MGLGLSLQIIDKIIEEEINEHIKDVKLIFKLIPDIAKVSQVLAKTLKQGNKILICGNGGSAADSQHFSSELIGRFEKKRKSLAAISLSTDTSAITSISNDFSFEDIFSRQIEGIGMKDDVLITISTSGKSKNILKAISKAKEKKMNTIGILGRDGGKAIKDVSYAINVNSQRTARIQEMHSLIIHIICALIEKEHN